MTDTEDQTPAEYLDEDGKPIPLLKREKATQNKGFSISFPKFIGTVAFIILLTAITPLYSILMRVTPDSWQAAILKPLYSNIPIGSQPQEYFKPMKLPLPEPGTLPVLGFDTRICFSFYSTIENPDPNYINVSQLERAKKGKIIAEIIAVGASDKVEYHMKETSYAVALDENNIGMSIICQKFGRTYGSTPEEINAIYIRPIKPFKAHKTVWKSIKHLYSEYTSPAELNGGEEPPP